MDVITDEELLNISILVLILLKQKRKKKKKINKSRRFWVRGIFKKRNQHGLYNNLIQELRFGAREFYFK